MASIGESMDEVYPPSSPNLFHVESVELTDTSDVQFKCLYLLIVILDMIETIFLGLLAVIGLFLTGMAHSHLQKLKSGLVASNNYMEPPVIPAEVVDVGDDDLWFFRIFFLFFLAMIIMVQVWGWKGYRKHHCCSIYAFASFKIVSTTALIALLSTYPNTVFICGFIIKLGSVIISFLFAHQVSQLKSFSRFDTDDTANLV